MSAAHLKWHIILYFNPDSLPVSTFDNLTQPHLTLLPYSPLAAPANSLVSLRLQLMKATPYISSFHWGFSAPAMSTDVSQVGSTLYPCF